MPLGEGGDARGRDYDMRYVPSSLPQGSVNFG